MLTDDEKFLFKHELKVEHTKSFARQNAHDIIACGFKLDKTFIFSNFNYVGGAFYENVSKISKQITYSQAKATFGFTDSCVRLEGHDSLLTCIPAIILARSISPQSRLRLHFPTASLKFLEHSLTSPV